MKKITTLFFTLLVIITTNISFAENNNDLGYLKLENSSFYGKIDENKKAQILYFFSYGCPYCYDFENYSQILKSETNKNVEFTYLPITVSPAWNEYTKAFYIADYENIDIRKDIFQEIHINNNKFLTKTQLFNFFESKYKMDYQTFNKRYSSSLVNYKIMKNEDLADFYEVGGTPSLIIIYEDGQTFKLSPTISKGVDNMFTYSLLLLKDYINDVK